MRAAYLMLAAACALVLAACAPAPDASRGADRAAWCGTSPPSGYCSVPETGK